MKYYTLDNILKKNADYNIIVGERSNGKTYASLLYGVSEYVKHGKEMAYMRRMYEDVKGSRAEQVFSALVSNGEIDKITNGEYNSIKYYRAAWYLAKDEEKAEKPFCYAFAISQMEHYKSQSYPNIYTIIFDEFITRTIYIPDEFNLFLNMLSTIIRQRDGIKIFMLGNTVNKYCPYFKEMGIPLKNMNAGDIITIENGTLKIAVEYTTPTKGGKKSDKYFNFKSKTVKMITGGAWEIAEYPKCPVPYTRGDIIKTFYLIFDENYITGEIVNKGGGNLFIFFHPKKENRIKEPETDLVYCDYSSYRRNYYNQITRPHDDTGRLIYTLFQNGKVFYSDNDTGEILRNYIQYSIEKAGMRKA